MQAVLRQRLFGGLPVVNSPGGQWCETLVYQARLPSFSQLSRHEQGRHCPNLTMSVLPMLGSSAATIWRDLYDDLFIDGRQC
jgi:hypothetical protein